MQDILEKFSTTLEPAKAWRPLSFSFPWLGMKVKASQRGDEAEITDAKIEIAMGFLPFNQENPFSREQAILLATMYSGTNKARFRISERGEVSYEIHLEGDNLSTTTGFGAEVTMALLYHLGVVREMTAFLHSN